MSIIVTRLAVDSTEGLRAQPNRPLHTYVCRDRLKTIQRYYTGLSLRPPGISPLFVQRLSPLHALRCAIRKDWMSKYSLAGSVNHKRHDDSALMLVLNIFSTSAKESEGLERIGELSDVEPHPTSACRCA